MVHRGPDGDYRVAWIGDLLAGTSSADLKFESTTVEQFADQWRDIPIFASSLRSSDEVWAQYFGKANDKPDLAQLSEVPELAADWITYQTLFTQSGNQQYYSRDDFRKVYQSVNNKSDVRVGRLFDAISDHLLLAPGECRLIGTTEQRLGRTRFDPEATQTDQQTLVVVHLQQPAYQSRIGTSIP